MDGNIALSAEIKHKATVQKDDLIFLVENWHNSNIKAYKKHEDKFAMHKCITFYDSPLILFVNLQKL
jgi:hypothetical protein